MLTVKELKNDREILDLIAVTEQNLEALGYTEHSTRHLSIVSNWAGDLMREIGGSEYEINMAEIAGFLHDIGNAVNRSMHAQSGGVLAYSLMVQRGMSTIDAAELMLAIGNHDEKHGSPVSRIGAVLILADKADVHKSRVRKSAIITDNNDIHDRVNRAAERSFLSVENTEKTITLNITIDTEISSVMDYFEIYFSRMSFCRRAAAFLGYKFSLKINNVVLL